MDDRAARRAAAHWIARLGLSGREDARVDTLSHGNQQRAQLAVALAHDPELLVLDEPFPGLDPGGVEDMSQVLAERAALGIVVAGGVFAALGYAFYCTVFAAAGSLVSRQSDVKSTIGPVQLPLLIAYGLTYTVIYSNGANAFFRVLGFLPPTSPIAMPVLYAAGDVPAWQVAVSAVVCAAGTVWMARIAARISSNSILKTGPRIGFRQAIRESRNPAATRLIK